MTLHVERAGALTTVQDRGRRGLAHLGVPRAGPLDLPAAAFANRLVGNGPDAALLEVTWGGLELTTSTGAWVAVTGAPVPLDVDGVPRGCERAEWLPPGARLRLDGPAPERRRDDELPSEGMVLGAVQVPPGGQPVVFLADHPPTGGYPVLAVVHPDDLWQCAQLRPGEELRFVRGA